MLDNAQTYIGVLATFIVLCLFNDKKNSSQENEDNGNQNNFLLSILSKVGEEKLYLLKKRVEELQQDIYSIFENKEGVSNRISSLLNKAKSNDTRHKLLTILKAVRVQGNLFFKDANIIISKLEKQEEQVQKREELTYIALLSLMLIIVIMFVDCITILPIRFSCKFAFLLMLIGGFYSAILYKRYLTPKEDNIISNEKEISERFLKPLKTKMIIGMSLTFMGWNIMALFVCSEYFYIISLICIIWCGIWLTKRKWLLLCEKYNKYNRIFVLKHGIYIIIYSLVCTLLLEAMLYFSFIYELLAKFNWQLYLNNWNVNITFLSNPVLTKYLVLIFFTLNGLVLPFLLGYLKWNKLEKEAIRELDKLQNRRKEEVLKLQKEFQTIESQIEING